MKEKKEQNLIQKPNENALYGKNAVQEALLSGRSVNTLYVQQNTGGLNGIISLAKEAGAVIKPVTAQKLNELFPEAMGKHGGVGGWFSDVKYVTPDEILTDAKQKNHPPFLLILDGIQDPHNLGAIIRTAEAAGVDGLIIPKHGAASVNATVMKTSAGAANWLKIARVTNLTDTIKKLKQQGIWVYGAELGGKPLYEANVTGPVALVIGSEGKGLSRLVKEHCDEVLTIDMYGHVNSLNASVSAGIMIYEIVRQRKNG